jgi:hypothetical protein
VALLVFLLPFVLGASVPLVETGTRDVDPALVRLDDGSLLAAFTRVVGVAGQKVDADIYLVRAGSLGDAVLGVWARPVRHSAFTGDKEEGPNLFLTPGGLVGLAYTSDTTGIDQVYLSTAPPPGDAWIVPAAPLALGEQGGTATRWPDAIARGFEILLVYEADDGAGPAVHFNRSLSGVIWDNPVTVADPGRRPSITRLPNGDLRVVYEDPVSGGLLATSSSTGRTGSWTPPEAVPVPGGTEPALAVMWDGRTAAFASGTSPGGRTLQRSFRSDPGAWTAPEEMEGFGSAPVNGAPDPLAVMQGVLCMVFDSRSEEAFPPTVGQVFFNCEVDYSCTESPLFDGVREIVDPNPCQNGMLVVDWDNPTHYGSASISGARYYVYRDTDPDFVPSEANRITGPLISTFFVDTEVLPDTAYHYAVRAENFEECPDGGPMGGMMDGNSVRISGLDGAPQPPGPVAGLEGQRQADGFGRILFSWQQAEGATSYNVYRMDGESYREQDLVLVGRGIRSTEVLISEGSERMTFYLVKALSGCGIEGD